MRRASSLNIARYCGMAPVLGEKYGAGRSAAMSTAFHAVCSGKGAETALAMLTPEEREEIKQWRRPTDLPIEGGDEVLCYESADTERHVGITDTMHVFHPDDHGTWVKQPEDELIITGHWDMCWRIDVNGTPTVYVADIKRSRNTVNGEYPGDSLQLLAYGIMAAVWCDVDQFAVGYWFAEEGDWWWSHSMDLCDMGTAVKWEILKLAATTPEEYRPGSHCQQCWSRKHCPEWLLDPEGVRPELALFDPQQLTEKRAAEWLTKVKQAKDTIDAVTDQIKAAFPRGVRLGNGQVYKPLIINPKNEKVSIDAKTLRAIAGKQAENYISKKAPYEQWRNCKEKQ